MRVRLAGAAPVEVTIDPAMDLATAEAAILSQLPAAAGQRGTATFKVGFPPKPTAGLGGDRPCTSVFKDRDTVTVEFGADGRSGDIRRAGDGQVRTPPPQAPGSRSPPPSGGAIIHGVGNHRSGGAVHSEGGVARVENNTGG